MAYCDLADVKTYLGVSENTDDAIIQMMIESAQAAIDQKTHRTFEASADSTRYFDSYDDVDGRSLILDEDLAALTSATVDGTLLASTEYTTWPRNETPYHEIVIKRGSTFAWTDDNAAGDYDAEDAIEIVGRWAYSTTAPDDIRQACLRLAAYMYRQKDAQVFDVTAVPSAGVIEIPQGIPRDVERLLASYVRLD